MYIRKQDKYNKGIAAAVCSSVINLNLLLIISTCNTPTCIN